MSANLSPIGNGVTFFNQQGVILAGGKIFTCVAGSVGVTQLKATYTDSTQSVQNANPIIIGSNGMVPNEIWLTAGSSYKFVVTDSLLNTISSFDGIIGINDTSLSSSEWVATGITPTYVSSSTFTLPGDQTGTYASGRRVRAFVTAGAIYGTVNSSSFSSTTTTVVATWDSTSLDSGLSEVDVGFLSSTNQSIPSNLSNVLSVNGGSVRGRGNYLINGGAEVAQNTGSINLNAGATYGQVDQCVLWASSGSVSAGTLIQTTSSTVGRTGYAARASGCTLTGSTPQISWRYRVESLDAINLKNRIGSFQIAVMHNVGSAINYTIIVRKPTVSDNYGSTTVISTGSPVSVSSSVSTVLTLPSISMGDCSNGIEIEVQAACGAVTTKNFDFTEWQLEEGTICTTFERRDYRDELRSCLRYLPSFEPSSVAAGFAVSTTQAYIAIPLPVTARIAPTGISTTVSGSLYNSVGGAVALTTIPFGVGGKSAVQLFPTVASGLTAGNGTMFTNANRILFTGAQL